jgi:rhamnosyltransferase
MEKVNMTHINPTVSVIIPVKNEALKIRACIDGILQQTVRVHEIIVIDSGSSDETVAILKTYPQIKLIEIPESIFNHGDTRNLGAQVASGQFLLFTVGDARPFNEHWIEELLKGFLDNDVAAVCGQQVVPHEFDKNPMEWHFPNTPSQIIRHQFKNQTDFLNLIPKEKKKICGWDDVTAIYRSDIFDQISFQKTTYCEDAIWAKEAILNGHAIVYNEKAKVYHYHQENPDFTFRRTFTSLYFSYRHFGFIPIVPTLTLKKRLSFIRHIFIRMLSKKKINIVFWYRYNVRNFNASISAHEIFLKTFNKNEELDIMHERLCGKPPIPLKGS